MPSIYNAYLPREDLYEKIPEEASPPGSVPPQSGGRLNDFLQKLKLNTLDSGDILLMLILFLLLREGDRSDAVAALAIAAVFCLGGS